MRVVVRSRDAAGTHFGGAFWPFGQSVTVDVDSHLLDSLRAHPFLAVSEAESAPQPVEPGPVEGEPTATVTPIRRRRS